MQILNKIQRTLKAPKGQVNSFGNYKYRSCEDILEAVKPLLEDATLVISDEICAIGDRHYVKATATLTCGENTISSTAFAREPVSKKGMDESQITGAASSYARKYALNGLFAIDDTKDADSTNTHGKEKSPPKDLWQILIDRCDIEGLTIKEAKDIMAKFGVKTDKHLQAFTSKKAITVIKESV
jgi:hypothetical protein